MQFDWVTFGLQIVNVVVLLAILRHFLFRPVAEIVARRQTEIVASMDAADHAQAQAAKAEADALAEAQRTMIARNDVLAAARDSAENQQATLVEAARARAAKILDEARSDATQIAADAQDDTLRRARELAETIAAKALAGLPDPPTTSGFARRLTGELSAMSDADRTALLSGADLRLIAATAPSETDLAAARTALKPFGLANAPIVVDPTLISGLELRSATGVVYNSVVHDLDRISEALDHDDGSRA